MYIGISIPNGTNIIAILLHWNVLIGCGTNDCVTSAKFGGSKTGNSFSSVLRRPMRSETGTTILPLISLPERHLLELRLSQFVQHLNISVTSAANTGNIQQFDQVILPAPAYIEYVIITTSSSSCN